MKIRYVALVAAVLLGCSAQKGAGYQGDPELTLEGVAESVQTVDGVSVPVDIALVWWRGTLDLADGGTTPLNSPTVVASVEPITTSFPAKFNLDVLAPPPADVLMPCDVEEPGTASYALASVVALRRGADLTNVQDADILGRDYRYTVFYAPETIPKGAFCMPGGVAAGFHLYLDGIYEPPAGKLPVPVTIQAQAPALVTTPRTAGDCEAGGSSTTYGGPDFLFRDPSTIPPYTDPTTLTSPCVAPYFTLDAEEGTCGLPQIPASAWVDGSCLGSSVVGWCALPYPDANPDCRELVVSQATDLSGVIGGFPVDSNAIYQYP